MPRVVLIPGLLEPPLALWPLKRLLQKHGAKVDYFPDRWIFRDVERSIDRLANLIGNGDQHPSFAIVTHSFGDWLARQAIARTPNHKVDSLISVAPVMRTGWVPLALRLLSGNTIPEIRIITDPELAGANLDLGDRVRRLVIWAKADACVRSVPLEHVSNVQHVAATHLSLILQPKVLRKIEAFIFADGSG